MQYFFSPLPLEGLNGTGFRFTIRRMIVALIIAEKSGVEAEAYFAKANGGSALESLAGTVLRGPFGGTLVAARPEIASRAKETLSGFALQFVDTSRVKSANELNIEALKAAAAFRARWEKAMSAAGARFSKQKDGGTDWAKHKQHADVKVRGLARSFDRDGVMLIPASANKLSKERIAEMVECFARGEKASAATGEPVLLSLESANAGAQLKLDADFNAWLEAQR